MGGGRGKDLIERKVPGEDTFGEVTVTWQKRRSFPTSQPRVKNINKLCSHDPRSGSDGGGRDNAVDDITRGAINCCD